MDNRNIKKLTLLAIWTAVTFVLGRLFTFPIPGSAGNILTLLDGRNLYSSLSVWVNERRPIWGLCSLST